FGGRPIDEGNLYEWRHGGYEEWLWHEDRRDRLRSDFEHIAKLDAIGDGSHVAERLGALVAAELAKHLNFLEAISDMNDRSYRMQHCSRERARFRREKCKQQRLPQAEQCLENETERQRNVGRPAMVGCAPLQLQQKRHARSNASYSEKTVDCGPWTKSY